MPNALTDDATLTCAFEPTTSLIFRPLLALDLAAARSGLRGVLDQEPRGDPESLAVRAAQKADLCFGVRVGVTLGVAIGVSTGASVGVGLPIFFLGVGDGVAVGGSGVVVGVTVGAAVSVGVAVGVAVGETGV